MKKINLLISCLLLNQVASAQATWSINGGFSSHSTTNLTLQTNSTTRMTILNSNGFMGIGVTTPTELLDVNGIIRVRGLTQSNTLTRMLASDATGKIFWRDASTISSFPSKHFPGFYSIFLGSNSGQFITNNAYYNTALGEDALKSLTDGRWHNSSFGSRSMSNCTGCQNNTAVGSHALFYTSTGISNSVLGHSAMLNNTTGSNNVAVGNSGLSSNITGNNNTALGSSANVSSGDLSNATAIGANAIVSSSNSLVLGSGANVGIGTSSPAAKLDVVGNVKITDGTQGVGKVLTSDANGLAIWATPTSGGWGLTGNTGTVDGTNFIGTIDNVPLSFRVNNQKAGRIDHLLGNTFFGPISGNLNTTGISNSAFGSGSLTSNTTGGGNTANGYQALYSIASNSFNTAIGYQALYSSTDGPNTAIGSSSLYSNTTGSANTAVGLNALRSNTIGNSNTAVGSDALFFNLTGLRNNALGSGSLGNTTTGANNVAVGFLAGASSNGSYNVFLGNESGYNTTGNDNIASGYQALYANTSGNNNTANGSSALRSNTTGSNNIAIGAGSNYYNTVGNSNTAVGINSGPSLNNLDNTTALGNGAIPTASNSVRIGNASVTSIGGQVSWSTLSDGRFKREIKEDVSGLDFIRQLRPVSYSLDNDAYESHVGNAKKDRNSQARMSKSDQRYTGFVAQEVEAAMRKSGYVFSGLEVPKNNQDTYSIRYSDFVVPLVKAVQELSLMVERQQAEIESLKANRANTLQDNASDKMEGAVLYQNNPNPFTVETEIRMYIPNSVRDAKVFVYDMQGKPYTTIPVKDRAKVSVKIDAGVLSSGLYLYALVADGNVIDVKKMILTE